MGYATGNTRRFRLRLASTGARSTYSLPVSLEATHAKTGKTTPLSLQIQNNGTAKVGKCSICAKPLICRYRERKSLTIHPGWERTEPGAAGQHPGSPAARTPRPRTQAAPHQRHPAAWHPAPAPASRAACRDAARVGDAAQVGDAPRAAR